MRRASRPCPDAPVFLDGVPYRATMTSSARSQLPSNASALRADAFDLNIVKVLEHWTVAFAVRELIANALDEQTLTSTADPRILKVGDGNWHVRDFGRGLRYQHLTQNESAEKRKHPAVIG
jgi:hypothetical protein